MRRPTIDGTATRLAGHHAHDRLAVKARTEFRRHGRYPAWCLPRNLHYGDEPPTVFEITSVIMRKGDDEPMTPEVISCTACPVTSWSGR